MKLTSLFGDALESDDADKRARAVAELDSTDERLPRFATDDVSPKVRSAAVARLVDLDTLKRVSLNDGDDTVRGSASEGLVHVVCGLVDAAPDANTRIAWLRQHGDERLAADVTTRGAEPELRMAALERLEALGSATLENICETAAIGDGAAQVRAWAVQRVRSADAVERVLAAAKGHDKRVVQAARARLNALREAQAQRESRLRLCEQLEALAQNPEGDGSALVEVSFSARVQAIETEWRGLAGASDAQPADEDGEPETAILDARFGKALDAAREIVARYERQEAGQAALADALKALSSKLDAPLIGKELDRLAASWQALDGVSEAATRAFNDQLNRVRKQHDLAVRDKDREAAAERVLAPREKQLEAGDATAPGALRSLEKDWARVSLPQDSSLAEALTQRYQAAHDALRDALKRQKGDAASAAGELNGLLDKLEKRIEAGTLSEAESLYDKSRSRLQKALLDESRKAAAEKRLQTAATRIGELKRWRHWSTDKARETLCESAEELIGKQGKIAALAKDVRSLRDSWKKLDHADGPARQALWQRFNEACEKAYAPCKAHYDDQSARRAENLKTRETLCEDLRTLERDTDWSAPD
ncbi:MAG: DUF349 domain-containing protein, partial [Pseudomonadota bacterium]